MSKQLEYWHLQDRAHKAVEMAKKRGEIIKPSACESCHAQGRLHAHHDNYDNLLAVRWLCPKCHKMIHPGNRKKFPKRTIINKAIIASRRILA